jgi:signal transduction histidine kinase
MTISNIDTGIIFQVHKPEKTEPLLLFEKLKKQPQGTFFDYSVSGNHGLLVAASIPGTAGMILLEISPESINNIMLESGAEGGLGISGESYLIGDDQLFRSESRFSKGNVLKLKTNSPAALMAINGQTGIIECEDYRGIRVLSSFTKLQVPGLSWIILAEIDKSEAMIPVDRLRITILIFTVLTSIAFFVLTFLFARHITKPISKLTKAATSVGAGNLDSKVKIDNNDEIGELAESFNFMTDKLKMQNEQLLTERASRISSVIDGQEMERQHLSREMHDGVGQALSAIRLRLELASRSDAENTGLIVSQTKTLVDQTIEDVRAICRSLTPPALKEFGPITSIRRLAEDVSQHAGLRLNFVVNGNLMNPGIKSGTYLYRIAQEAINNAVKHANAQTLEISLTIDEKNIEFTCKDDGQGFDILTTPSGNGILNMKERAQLIDGFFSLTSIPGKGTSIIVKIPFTNDGTD